MKVYWRYYSQYCDQVHCISWPDWMLGRHGRRSKTVTDGTLFVNTPNLLHIWLESSIYINFSMIISTSFVPQGVVRVMYEKKNGLSVTITPSLLNGNGRDRICKHFQHFKVDDFYNPRYKSLKNKHTDHWHRHKYLPCNNFEAQNTYRPRIKRKSLRPIFSKKRKISHFSK